MRLALGGQTLCLSGKDKNSVASIILYLVKCAVSTNEKILRFICIFNIGNDTATTDRQITCFLRPVFDSQRHDFGAYSFQYLNEIVAT